MKGTCKEYWWSRNVSIFNIKKENWFSFWENGFEFIGFLFEGDEILMKNVSKQNWKMENWNFPLSWRLRKVTICVILSDNFIHENSIKILRGISMGNFFSAKFKLKIKISIIQGVIKTFLITAFRALK
jgi:hypothetical protein